MKKYFTLLFLLSLLSFTSIAQIAAWDFFGQSSPVTFAATTYNSNLSSSNLVTRGAGAASSAASNSFRTLGFQNNGIATTNTDYFQITLSPASGYLMSLSSLDARLNGTPTFAATPGVSSQFAYSTDGVNFTLIGSPSITIGVPTVLPQINVSGVAALQNISFGTTVTLRYYASGQTTTGGWGFASSAVGQNGLAVGGAVTTVLPISTVQIFTANKTSSTSSLNWFINCNTNAVTIDVERSANGRNFEKIFSQTATQERCNAPFAYTDAQPLKAVNYYRLKVTNVDGEVFYSGVASTRFGSNEPIKVVPTIATNDVQVFYEAAAAGISTWIVYDASGRAVSKTDALLTKGQNAVRINVSNLNKGQYQISGITALGKTETVQIIKQ